MILNFNKIVVIKMIKELSNANKYNLIKQKIWKI